MQLEFMFVTWLAGLELDDLRRIMRNVDEIRNAMPGDRRRSELNFCVGTWSDKSARPRAPVAQRVLWPESHPRQPALNLFTHSGKVVLNSVMKRLGSCCPRIGSII